MSRRIKLRTIIPTFCAAFLCFAQEAHAHPHIFAQAHLDVEITKGHITALQHVWRFDEIFTSTVMIDFDENGDNKLSDEELHEVASVVLGSLADYDYFQIIIQNEHEIRFEAPSEMLADMPDGQLVLIFQSKPKQPIPLGIDKPTKLQIAVYDPTFYTAIDYQEDGDIETQNLPSNCKRRVVRPDPDEIIAQNEKNLTEAFYETTDLTDLSGIFATSLEITCTPLK